MISEMTKGHYCETCKRNEAMILERTCCDGDAFRMSIAASFWTGHLALFDVEWGDPATSRRNMADADNRCPRDWLQEPRKVMDGFMRRSRQAWP